MNLSPLNSLIRQARQRVEVLVEGGKEAELGTVQFAACYRTLNFNLGRGAGHTTFIRDDFAEGEDVAIVPRSCLDVFRGAAGVFTKLTDATRHVRNNKGIRDIWIDEPTVHLKGLRDVEALSELLHHWRHNNRHNNGMVIFLGGHMA